MRLVRRPETVALVLIAAGAAFAALAQDLPASDPDRAAILAAANVDPTVALDVKRLVKTGGYAFVCTLMKGLPSVGDDGTKYPGGYWNTDGELDVRLIVLKFADGKWTPRNLQGRFASTPDKVDCTVDHKTIETVDQIKTLYDSRSDGG